MSMLSDFISLFFPVNCSGCNTLLIHSEKAICSTCLMELNNYSCKNPDKFVFGRKEIDEFVPAFDLIKNSTLHKILHNIKYNNDKISAYVLGIELGKKLYNIQMKEKFDCIIPIPISNKKLKKRKFNQSEEIAKGVKKVIGVSIETGWLLRKNNLKSQIYSNRFQRSNNVREEYYINKKKTLGKKRLLILDDVVTTGATIQSCLEAIKELDDKSIYFASIALTKRD